MSDKPEWLRRIHDAVNDARPAIYRPTVSPDDLAEGLVDMGDEPRGHDLDGAVGRLLLAQHRQYSLVEVQSDDLRDVLAELAELRATRSDVTALRELLGGVDTDELGRVTLVPTAELDELRAIEQRGRDMVDPLCTCGGCTSCAIRFVLDGPGS